MKTKYIFLALIIWAANACTEDQNLVTQRITSGGSFSWNDGVGATNEKNYDEAEVTFIVENTGEFSFQYCSRYTYVYYEDNYSYIDVFFSNDSGEQIYYGKGDSWYKTINYGTVYAGQRITIKGYEICVKDIKVVSSIISDDSQQKDDEIRDDF